MRIPVESKMLERLRERLAESPDLGEVVAMRDKAIAVRRRAASARLDGAILRYAAELTLRLERRAGKLLKAMMPHGGDRKSPSRRTNLTLTKLRIDHNTSARWRREAAVPEPIFKDYIYSANRQNVRITAQGLLRLEQHLATEQANRWIRRLDPADFDRLFRSQNGRQRQAEEGSAARNDNDKSTRSNRRTATAIGLKLIDQIRRRRSRLAEILAPVCKGQREILSSAEKRAVARQLSGIDSLLDRLVLACRSAPDGD